MGKIKIIAGISANGVIGLNNDLIFKDSEDLKRFKKLTTGHSVLMGRKTWESLGSKPLKDRFNIVVTSKKPLIEGFIRDTSGLIFPPYSFVEENYKLYKEDDQHDLWIIGGGELYFSMIDKADELHITRWNKEAVGDTFFPDIDETVWVRKFIEYPKKSKEFVYETWIKR